MMSGSDGSDDDWVFVKKKPDPGTGVKPMMGVEAFFARVFADTPQKKSEINHRRALRKQQKAQEKRGKAQKASRAGKGNRAALLIKRAEELEAEAQALIERVQQRTASTASSAASTAGSVASSVTTAGLKKDPDGLGYMVTHGAAKLVEEAIAATLETGRVAGAALDEMASAADAMAAFGEFFAGFNSDDESV